MLGISLSNRSDSLGERRAGATGVTNIMTEAASAWLAGTALQALLIARLPTFGIVLDERLSFWAASTVMASHMTVATADSSHVFSHSRRVQDSFKT